MTCPDIIFSVLYIGNVDMLIDAIVHMINTRKCDWDIEHMRQCSIDQLRVAFFLLMDRDISFKEQMLKGWPEINIDPLSHKKAEHFFERLKEDVIDKWLIDERLGWSWFLDSVTDLYLVS